MNGFDFRDKYIDINEEEEEKENEDLDEDIDEEFEEYDIQEKEELDKYLKDAKEKDKKEKEELDEHIKEVKKQDKEELDEYIKEAKIHLKEEKEEENIGENDIKKEDELDEDGFKEISAKFFGGKEPEETLMDEDEFNLDTNEEIIGEEDIFPDENKERKSNTVSVVVAICAVVLISFLALGGYTVYRSADPPKIVSVHIESDNTENPQEAKYGNMITLTFSFKEELSNMPMVIINNKGVKVYGKGKEYYAKYFVQVQGKEDQPVEFSIHGYKNIFQKTGKPVTETTDGSSVIIPAYK